MVTLTDEAEQYVIKLFYNSFFKRIFIVYKKYECIF